MKKLTLDSLQINELEKMLENSVVYYGKEFINASNLIDLTNYHLRYESILEMHALIFELCTKINNDKLYRESFKLTNKQSLVFLTSIIPCGNFTYLQNVKQTVVDYCVEVLKEANIIPNSPTYTLSDYLNG